MDKKGAIPYKINFDEDWICKYFPNCNAGENCQWKHVKPNEQKIDWEKFNFAENTRVEGATAVLPGDNNDKVDELKNALIESQKRHIEQLTEQIEKTQLPHKEINNNYQP